MQPTKTELLQLIDLVRGYGSRLLNGIDPTNLTWIPPSTKGRSILSYFAHILNAEIYWLKTMGDNTFDYIGKDASFADGQLCFSQLRDHLREKVLECIPEETVLRKPQKDPLEEKVPGSLAWMIWRTSMHALHHFAQIAYIRHTVGNPPEEGAEYAWSQVMDRVVALAHQTEAQ